MQTTMSVNEPLSAILSFLLKVLSRGAGSYLSEHLRDRPRKIATLKSGDELDFQIGFHRIDNFVICDAIPSEFYRPIHEAASTNWRRNEVLNYKDIAKWVADGARYPNRKRTLGRYNSKNPEATANQLIGRVFQKHY